MTRSRLDPARRHPAEVTSDRLAEHVEKYHGLLSGEDRDAFSWVRHVLEGIATGTYPEDGDL